MGTQKQRLHRWVRFSMGVVVLATLAWMLQLRHIEHQKAWAPENISITVSANCNEETVGFDVADEEHVDITVFDDATSPNPSCSGLGLRTNPAGEDFALFSTSCTIQANGNIEVSYPLSAGVVTGLACRAENGISFAGISGSDSNPDFNASVTRTIGFQTLTAFDERSSVDPVILVGTDGVLVSDGIPDGGYGDGSLETNGNIIMAGDLATESNGFMNVQLSLTAGSGIHSLVGDLEVVTGSVSGSPPSP